jgi:Amt family ammonium transporter
VGAIAGILVVFLVGFFDRIHIDDPVGSTSVHLGCGVFGTIFIGLFAKAGIPGVTESVDNGGVNGLFYGGGLNLLGKQFIGILAVGGFTFCSSFIVWFLIKKTLGIRVTAAEELQGLDIGEHGNTAYPDFVNAEPLLTIDETAIVIPESAVPPEKAVEVHNHAHPGAKITRVSIITNQNKFSSLQNALDTVGITGVTVTNVLGYGMQKGGTEIYRGVKVESKLLPKIQIDIVICKVPTEVLTNAVKAALYTGAVGDGKIFIYDVENVIKVRTGEEGYDALQDEI